jgi:carbon monoxide dehydrogenase subunit G
MEMNGSQTITASVDRTWQALNDPQTLKACIPGCESIQPVGDDTWIIAMNVRIGPVSARFKGRLGLSNINPPNAYTIDFEGQGGAAFARGSADVKLSPAEQSTLSEQITLLEYEVDAQVGGKIAQVGARLVSAASRKLADDFFKRFNERVAVGESDG